ncbi:hypothetical protein Pyn_13741 [Prunus yedoensis var. nudiflora]|uniref:Uncharacterized protein n=1 Tax=Prunus yedoensis var. nudiflora TaxID=2094558 RepID=A0A314YK15_PRUYE|nr:hypothetical protein Pyn_13741 [Prunus yedoensis var. nudiflora]
MRSVRTFFMNCNSNEPMILEVFDLILKVAVNENLKAQQMIKKGKISREEVARICVAALESPYASGKTFEVKSVVPFSEPFTADPQNPSPEKDYNVYFKTLKDEITGKEILKQDPVPV